MKILVLPAYYYPEQAASPYLGDNIREAMCNAGFILDLYAPMPTRGVSEEIRVEYKERKIEYKYDNKLVIHRFPMYSKYTSYSRCIGLFAEKNQKSSFCV